MNPALWQVANRYCWDGRTMNTAMLKDTFQNLLHMARVMALVRGGCQCRRAASPFKESK